MTGNNNSNVRQSFAVYLGTSASADGMTTKLAEFNDTINSDHKATKELLPLVIDKTDNYFIGVKCTTANSLGSLVLDQFAISNPVEGKSIPVGGSYDADFATREGEWYHYHPTNTSSQWTVATADGEKYMTTKRSYVSYMGTWTTPGIYESPAFKFAAAGGKVALADGKLVVTGDYVKGEIYSVSGLLSKTFANAATVDVSDLSQGIYIVRITTESGVATAKIVVR